MRKYFQVLKCDRSPVTWGSSGTVDKAESGEGTNTIPNRPARQRGVNARDTSHRIDPAMTHRAQSQGLGELTKDSEKPGERIGPVP